MMKKSYEEKIAELREEIGLGLSLKNKVLLDITLLNDKLHNSVINERDYKRELNKKYRGRTKHELLDFCDKQISRLKRKHELYESKNRKRTQQHLNIPLALLLILLLAVGFFVFKPALTGYATVTSVSNYTQNLGLAFNFSTEYTWFLEHPGNLKSIKLDGKISKDGYAQVYIVHNGVKYIVFDSDALVEEGLIGITGLVILNVSETNVSEHTQKSLISDETIINETIPLNETNETIINETIPLNETINETVTLNETINETNISIENITNITKKITINLEYKSGTIYDSDDDGVEAIDGIIDFTVENSGFNWNVDYTKLCTKWETYSLDNNEITTVCYGSDTCCMFINLMPTSLVWNESFLSAYAQHGASFENIISSQILYVDYNVSLENPYTDIHNSEWSSLNATYYEKETPFSNICIDTCLLYGFNETFYTLMFNVSNATIIVDSVDYSILEEIENISLVNVTVVEEKVQQYKAVINRPVRWKKTVKLANETDKLTVELPKEVKNVSVSKIINKTIKEDVVNVKIKTKGVVNELDDYNLITGSFVADITGENIFSRFFNWFRGITGFAVVDIDNSTELIIEENVTEIEVEYETPGPEAVEEDINAYKKRIIISSEVHYTDILSYTYLPIETQERNIKLYWVNDSGKSLVNFDAYDTDYNGLMDYIEWIIPSLSNQTYEVEITILNVQSYPMVMGNWTVMFNTTGVANLTITTADRTTYAEMSNDNLSTRDDLELRELICADEVLEPYYIVDIYEVLVSETIINETQINETNATIINATNQTVINATINETITNVTTINATIAINETNGTIINETIINETQINETIINETSPINETQINMSETNVSEHIQNLTLLNETIPINETNQTVINATTNETLIGITGLVILNETIINETIPINETNQTTINETIPLNETNQTTINMSETNVSEHIQNLTLLNETQTNATIINETIPLNETKIIINETNQTIINETQILALNATIIEIDGKTYYLMTKEQLENHSYKIKGIFYPDYNCSGVGYHTVKVLTTGRHTQLFMFGDQTAYAYNLAGDNPPESNGTFIGAQLDTGITGLVSYWEFEDSSQDTMNLHNGTAIGAVNASGRVGKAYGFNGSDAFVNVSDTDSLNMTDNLSIEFWFRPDVLYDSSKNASLLYLESGYEVYMKDEKIIFSYGDDTVNTPAKTWDSDKWYYVVAVSDGITMRIYIDAEGQIAYDFYIHNDAGTPVAKFSSTGDIVLKGSCGAGSCDYPSDDDGLVIQDSNADTVAYINSTGDLCIEDSNCDYNDGDCDDPGDGAFIIQDVIGTIASYINSTGDLCLKGLLTENGTP